MGMNEFEITSKPIVGFISIERSLSMPALNEAEYQKIDYLYLEMIGKVINQTNIPTNIVDFIWIRQKNHEWIQAALNGIETDSDTLNDIGLAIFHQIYEDLLNIFTSGFHRENVCFYCEFTNIEHLYKMVESASSL